MCFKHARFFRCIDQELYCSFISENGGMYLDREKKHYISQVTKQVNKTTFIGCQEGLFFKTVRSKILQVQSFRYIACLLLWTGMEVRRGQTLVLASQLKSDVHCVSVQHAHSGWSICFTCTLIFWKLSSNFIRFFFNPKNYGHPLRVRKLLSLMSRGCPLYCLQRAVGMRCSSPDVPQTFHVPTNAVAHNPNN